MTTANLTRTVARDAARMAARLCLSIRGEMLRNRDFMQKAGQEPVTLADFGAQAVVLHYISERFPDDCTMAEERAADFQTLANAQQKAQIVHYVSQALGARNASLADISRWLDTGNGNRPERVWVVDPIDGTMGFMRGDQFAVAVALLVNGEPMVGALACPLLSFNPQQPERATGVIAVAARGEPATIEPLAGGYARPLRVSSEGAPSQARAVESVESGHADHAFHQRVFEAAGIEGEAVRMDSQAKYVAVADGRAEFYIRHSGSSDYREKVWDHAAGMLVVQQAGGRITDLDGKLLDFTMGERLENNRGVLASNGKMHDLLLEAIAGAYSAQV